MWPIGSKTVLTRREIDSSSRPVEAFERLRGGTYPWLLESALPSARLGRFSFAGADPYAVLRIFGQRARWECVRPVHPDLPTGCRELDGDPFEVVRSLLPPPLANDSSTPAFVGGAVGYLGYELAGSIEALGLRARDDLGLADLVLLFVDRVLAFDHQRGTITACGLGFGDDESVARRRAERSASELVRALERPAPARVRRAPAGGSEASGLETDASEYAKAIDAALEEIAAGNVYQACLTRRIERAWRGDPWELYRRLRDLNPAPFASYFELPELVIVGSSPERFVSLDCDGLAESRPIKGTRPRGASPAEDRELRRRLARSEKDRAENLMIVDLVRNDLGRVCETGSVEVPELMAIEEYASVFQMVSTVRGRLRADRDALDLVRATFPPGSMTGAPKIAAMRVLDRLEPVRRGVYSGAVGYFDARGGADLSVTIRTALLCSGRAHVHTGGGIVADSDPADEYRETLDKAAPLLAALEETK